MNRIDIVIVNYRTADLTIDCLRSLAPQMEQRPADRVFVTDNKSGDDSVERIGVAIEKEDMNWATLMPLEENGGFAYGNNAAIRESLGGDDKPAYILLLNPDTIVRGGAIDALRQFMEDREEVGIAGSRLEDPDGTAQRSAFRFPGVLSEFENGVRLGVVTKLFAGRIVAPPAVNERIETDWVAGASMMIRREVFDKIGLLDDAYFMYYEEVDFCLRARRAGFACWYVPESRVVHLVGQASGVTDTKRVPKRRPAYWFESRRRFFVRQYGRFYAAAADVAWIIGYSTWRLRRMIQRKPDTDPPKLLGDFIRHSVLIHPGAAKV